MELYSWLRRSRLEQGSNSVPLVQQASAKPTELPGLLEWDVEFGQISS